MTNLSVVIPIYNSARYIRDTLDALIVSLEFAAIKEYEVIVVDDGSTDELNQVIAELPNIVGLKIAKIKNSGRLSARNHGLKLANYDLILLIDSRVLIKKESIKQAISSFKSLGKPILIPTVEYKEGLPSVAYFWEGLEKMAWRFYFENPRVVKLDEVNFNRVPKGTTSLMMSREPFLSVAIEVSNSNKGKKHLNDDTLIFRNLLAETPIYLDPNFRVVYTPRSNFRDFLIHATHRGTVASDGYFHRESSARRVFIFGISFVAILVSLIVYIDLKLLFPLAFFGVLLGLYLSRGVPLRARISNFLYFPAFALAYVYGILKSKSSFQENQE